MNMNNINENDYCCGCGGCLSICPNDCIDLIQDENGFWKARCHEKECILCGRCTQVCPILNTSGKTDKTNSVFAAVTKEKAIYERSASGGVFSHAARYILTCNGYVFGCGYSNNIKAMHKEVNSLSGLDDLCRSKYVQSYMGRTYERAKNRLCSGAMVLFVGTPCQVAGLKNMLNKNYDNLFLIDLVCHGVPSPEMFEKNIEYIEKKCGKKLKRYEFRKKTSKFPDVYSFTYTYTDGSTKIGPYYKDAYFNAFYSLQSLNECCYICPYACEERTGDLTIGDFGWGKKYHSEFGDYSDLSCVLVNTKKGKELLSAIENEMIIAPTKWEYILERNKNLLFPTKRPDKRNELYNYINTNGYEKWAKHYFKSFEYLKKTKVFRYLRTMKNNIKNLNFTTK